MSHNIFQFTKNSPYHLSAGVVAVNSEGKVGAHYFKRHGKFEDFYLLVRETVEAGETLQQAAERGLLEEFGALGRVLGYLGSRLTSFKNAGGVEIQKTTAYMLMRVDQWDPKNRKTDDPEAHSRIEWHDPTFLLQKMREQGARLADSDLDESEIIERFLRFQWAHPSPKA